MLRQGDGGFGSAGTASTKKVAPRTRGRRRNDLVVHPLYNCLAVDAFGEEPLPNCRAGLHPGPELEIRGGLPGGIARQLRYFRNRDSSGQNTASVRLQPNLHRRAPVQAHQQCPRAFRHFVHYVRASQRTASRSKQPRKPTWHGRFLLSAAKRQHLRSHRHEVGRQFSARSCYGFFVSQAASIL